ncbi:MAG TPA: ribonuclease III [Clostridiales bacterium]|nr:ribonuclease III [Clostridiales bacterium]
MRQDEPDLQKLETAIGHQFSQQSLLSEALTHSTYAYEHRYDGVISNERLEFLGDAVLDLAISDELFRQQQMYDEGFMTKTRALVVCESTLASLARQLEIGDMLYLGKGEATTFGKTKPSNLSNTMEALFGAVYLDAGFEKARQVILNLLSGAMHDALDGSLMFDYKSKLLEYAQSMNNIGPLRFTILDEQGPVHEKQYTAGVLQHDRLIGRGTGANKKEAEQQAAKVALEFLKNKNP